ncbi:hypothetical protein FI667_g14511, partial [Globisporangium splendens]
MLPSLTDLVESRCPSPPTYPYRKCLLDVAITPTKTILKRLETSETKSHKLLTLFDLLSVDERLLAEKKRFTPGVHHRRQCGVPECVKYALSGGFCIRHGGGKRCSHDGCQTVAQSGGRCKAHGGGSKCKVMNCNNVARRKGFCMSHGGRQPCKVDGCAKCAHGGGFCISHGGGKRCASLDCLKSAQAGGFCYSHGGGKRCSAPQCFQAARKGGLCIRHRKVFNCSIDANRALVLTFQFDQQRSLALPVARSPSSRRVLRSTPPTCASQAEKLPRPSECRPAALSTLNYQDVHLYSSSTILRGSSIQDEPIRAVPWGTDQQGLRTLLKPCEASRVADNASSRTPLQWNLDYDCSVVSDTSRVSGYHVSGGPTGVMEWMKEKQQKSDCGDVEDSTNVDDLSELLTHIENEDVGVDFSVFIEDEDALNVEEISDVFTTLEHVSSSLATKDEDVDDARNVDDVSGLFSFLEQAESVDSDKTEDVSDAANIDALSAVFSALEEASPEEPSDDQVEKDQEDADNIDFVADVFSSLAAESETQLIEASVPTAPTVSVRKETSDWIDSLEVDNMSSLFSELERREDAPVVQPAPIQAKTEQVDSRIFVPKFAVRIEGRAGAAGFNRPVLSRPFVAHGAGSSSQLLAGPPSAFLVGPPQLAGLSREDRVERWKEKRKTRSFVPKEPDASISDTRRACAAKRQRVKGRFTSEKSAFVSITALQN